MNLSLKDLGATVVTALTVLVFAANHESWSVWLIGDSRRWAIGAVALLGIAGCGFGSAGKDVGTKMLAPLGMLAFVLLVAAFVTGSLTLFSLLVADIVVLWLGSTIRHASAPHRRLLSH
jgi:hypothetical protein